VGDGDGDGAGAGVPDAVSVILVPSSTVSPAFGVSLKTVPCGFGDFASVTVTENPAASSVFCASATF
jgi:hypothetical protein